MQEQILTVDQLVPGKQFILCEGALRWYSYAGSLRGKVYTITKVLERDSSKYSGPAETSRLASSNFPGGTLFCYEMAELPKYAASPIELTKTPQGNLKITIEDPVGLREICENDAIGWERKELDALEYHLCNGWTLIASEYIGLTSCYGISDSVEYDPNIEDEDVIVGIDRFYCDFESYQIRSWLEVLLRDGTVELKGYDGK